jgi:hypothetical protein
MPALPSERNIGRRQRPTAVMEFSLRLGETIDFYDEDRLRNIKPNRANLIHGRLPSMWFALTQPPYGNSMPQSGRRPQHQKLPLATAPGGAKRTFNKESTSAKLFLKLASSSSRTDRDIPSFAAITVVARESAPTLLRSWRRRTLLLPSFSLFKHRLLSTCGELLS